MGDAGEPHGGFPRVGGLSGVAQARRPLLRDPARGGACRSSAGLLTMVGVAEVSRFLVDQCDRPREVRQIARVARCPARPAMRPFARLTVVAAPLTPITRSAAHTGASAWPNRGPEHSAVHK